VNNADVKGESVKVVEVLGFSHDRRATTILPVKQGLMGLLRDGEAQGLELI
jgi:hypothetical protein